MKFLWPIFTLSLLISCSQGGEDSELVADFPSNSNSAVNVDDSEEASEEVSSPTIEYLFVSSSLTSLQVGDSTSLSARAYYSNGTLVDVSSSVSWISSSSSIVSVSAKEATAESAGTAILTATLEGKSASLSIVPFSATETELSLNTSSATISTDGSLNLKATVLYDNGMEKDVSSEATWSSLDTSVANIDSDGIITAVASGTTTVQADYNSFTQSMIITVSSATIQSIEVTPIIGSGAINENKNFYATALMSDSTIQDITAVGLWSSSDTSILNINSSGVAQLINTGTVSVSFDYGAHSQTVNFTVSDKTLSSLSINLTNTTASTGLNIKASCSATYSDGSIEDVTESVSWGLSDNSLATISNTNGNKGSIQTLSPGTVTVQASLNGESNTIDLTITSATLSTINITPSETFISVGINARFQATGVFSDGSEVDITSNVSWQSSDTSLGTISNVNSSKGYFTNLYSGSTTQSMNVTATLNSVSATSSIIIAPGTITSLSVTPTTISMHSLKTHSVKAFAHFSDGASVDITNITTWSSGDDSIVFVSNSLSSAGEITSLSEGSTQISAQYNGVTSGTIDVTVDDESDESTNEVGTGLSATYYSGNAFDTAVGQRIDSQLLFNWSTGLAPLGVGDYFSVRWTGQISGKTTGDCTIASRSDDGFRVYIDGVLLIDVWFAHAPRWDYAYNVAFEEGVKQDITVEFFENGGNAVAELYWQCDGDAAVEAIPTEFLFSE